ncbi:hypothetical protein DB31_0997 [Hyalangium minutum]|uniref:Uncharacterized protein n=1 Tax=Hyalangium minutum TaxID=394096 RepID=A0A085WFR1_9BACT|nr:hypothetical protein DB31_0997 [Hyalangium minutum]
MKRERLLWAWGWVTLGIGIGWAAARVPWGSLSRRRTGLGPALEGPAESWRGSGLAEDVGMDLPRGEEGRPEEIKQRMMEEAARELGLPEPNERR